MAADEGGILSQAKEGIPFAGRDQAGLDEHVSDLADVGDPHLGRGRTAVVDGQVPGRADILEPGRGQTVGQSAPRWYRRPGAGVLPRKRQ